MNFERLDMESAPAFRSYDAALDELTILSKVDDMTWFYEKFIDKLM